MPLISEASARPAPITAPRVTRTVRKLRAPLFEDATEGRDAPERSPLSLKDLLWMNSGDLSEVVDNEETLVSAVSRMTGLASYGISSPCAASAYHRVVGVPSPCRDDASAWITDDRGLTFRASFPAQSRLFHYATVPVIAVCGFNKFCPKDRVRAAQALDRLAERDVRSADEMARFRGVQDTRLDTWIDYTLDFSFDEPDDPPDKRQYQQSLNCPVVIVSLANPSRWTLSICDGKTADHDLFVDWIDGRIVSVSSAYLDDAELRDMAPTALPTRMRQA